jgi:hypothetical protein
LRTPNRKEFMANPIYEEILMTPEEVIAKVRARAKANFRTGMN